MLQDFWYHQTTQQAESLLLVSTSNLYVQYTPYIHVQFSFSCLCVQSLGLAVSLSCSAHCKSLSCVCVCVCVCTSQRAQLMATTQRSQVSQPLQAPPLSSQHRCSTRDPSCPAPSHPLTKLTLHTCKVSQSACTVCVSLSHYCVH